MIDPNLLYTGLSQAAWGYFFVSVDFNLNGVSVLPRFVGWLLLLSASGKLSAVRRELSLLRPLCALLAAWCFGDWLLSWGGGDIDGRFPFLDLVVAVTALYFHFQFLTDMAGLAERYQLDNGNLPAHIRCHRTAYTLLITIISLLGSVFRMFPWRWWPGIIAFAAVITCIVALLIMMDLFHLRRLVRMLENGPQ